MRFVNAPPAVVLATQTECWLAATITDQFPAEERPYGKENLFLGATERELKMARLLGPYAFKLSERFYRAKSQPDIVGAGGYRKAGTVGKFRPHVVDGRDYEFLADAALIVAAQEVPEYGPDELWGRSEFEGNAVRSTIEKARLFGILLAEHHMLDGRTDGTATTFMERYHTSHEIRTSASVAAKLLLSQTYHEFTHAAQGDDDVWPDATEHLEATRAYERENRLIVDLARMKPRSV